MFDSLLNKVQEDLTLLPDLKEEQATRADGKATISKGWLDATT